MYITLYFYPMQLFLPLYVKKAQINTTINFFLNS